MAFELPNLPYAHDALEPHIDAKTMEIHHGKHHNGYTTNLNNAVEGTNLAGESIENILANISSHSGAVAEALLCVTASWRASPVSSTPS